MVAEHVTQVPEFSGTRKFKTLGARVFEVLRAHGMFMSGNAPIRIPIEELAAFLVGHDGVKRPDVLTVIRENPDVFATETRDGTEYVVTTREGHVPDEGTLGITHSLGERFLTPEPKPARPAPVAVTRVRVDPNWATYSMPDLGDDQDEFFEPEIVGDEAVEVVVETPEIAPPVIPEPAVAAGQPVVEAEADIAPAPAAEAETLIEPEPDIAPAPSAEAETLIEPEPDIAPAPAAETETLIEPEPEPIQTTRPVAAVSRFPLTDVSANSDAEIAAALETQLAGDPRVAHFASQWMHEERVPRLSRGDLRRMKEYIQEQEQPLTDSTLVQDILNVRPNSVEFDLMQFAVNFRLSREHRDFDFVGTNDQRFWSTSGLPQIGTTRRKPNEIGTDYRFLLDEKAPEGTQRTEQSVDHVLSFYEYSLGLLPYDPDFQRLLPRQVSDDQRSAVLTFEIPQSYTTYLVELRYPTPNRGGFLLGLDDLYAETLVPGAMISVAATENDGHFKVEFLASPDQNARLLELDDRRSPRYLFRPTTFACEVVPEWLISEDRYPRIGSERPLDDKIRRRAEAVVGATFERIGIEDGDAYVASFTDLLAAVNIERPFSTGLLRTALEQDSKVTSDDTDTFTYVAHS